MSYENKIRIIVSKYLFGWVKCSPVTSTTSAIVKTMRVFCFRRCLISWSADNSWSGCRTCRCRCRCNRHCRRRRRCTKTSSFPLIQVLHIAIYDLAVIFMSPSRIVNESIMFSGRPSVRPSVRPLSINTYSSWSGISVLSGRISINLGITWVSIVEKLLKLRGQRSRSWPDQLTYIGGVMPIDGVA